MGKVIDQVACMRLNLERRELIYLARLSMLTRCRNPVDDVRAVTIGPPTLNV